MCWLNYAGVSTLVTANQIKKNAFLHLSDTINITYNKSLVKIKIVSQYEVFFSFLLSLMCGRIYIVAKRYFPLKNFAGRHVFLGTGVPAPHPPLRFSKC